MESSINTFLALSKTLFNGTWHLRSAWQKSPFNEIILFCFIYRSTPASCLSYGLTEEGFIQILRQKQRQEWVEKTESWKKVFYFFNRWRFALALQRLDLIWKCTSINAQINYSTLKNYCKSQFHQSIEYRAE